MVRAGRRRDSPPPPCYPRPSAHAAAKRRRRSSPRRTTESFLLKCVTASMAWCRSSREPSIMSWRELRVQTKVLGHNPFASPLRVFRRHDHTIPGVGKTLSCNMLSAPQPGCGLAIDNAAHMTVRHGKRRNNMPSMQRQRLVRRPGTGGRPRVSPGLRQHRILLSHAKDSRKRCEVQLAGGWNDCISVNSDAIRCALDVSHVYV